MKNRQVSVSWAVAALSLFAGALPSIAQDSTDPNFKTSSIGPLCVNAFNLKEAWTAAAAGDQKWIQSLNCVTLPAGLSVLRIQPYVSSFTEAWQVRVRLPSGEGVTLWGHHPSFTLPNGEKVR